MKNFILLLVLATSIFENSEGLVRFQLTKLDPNGFRASTAHYYGYYSITFNANVNRNITANEIGQFSGNFNLRNDNWVYENPTANLKKDDTLHYYCVVETETALLPGYGEFKVPA